MTRSSRAHARIDERGPDVRSAGAGADLSPEADHAPVAVAADQGVHRRLAEVGLIGVAAGWGLTFTLIHDAVESIAPLSFVAFRFLLAGLALGLPYRAGICRLSREGWRTGALLGLVLFAGYVFQTVGLMHTTATSAGFVTGLYVVATPLLGRLVLGQKLSTWAWGCIGAAAVGLLLLSGFGGGWHPLGDSLMVGCSLSFAAHILMTDRAVARFPAGPLVAVQLVVCGVAAMAVSVGSGSLALPRGRAVWTALLFTAIVASAMAYLLQSYAQRRISPARTALILATEPAFAGVFGYLLAGDRLTTVAWVGAATMTAAVLAMEAGPLIAARRGLVGQARRRAT